MEDDMIISVHFVQLDIIIILRSKYSSILIFIYLMYHQIPAKHLII